MDLKNWRTTILGVGGAVVNAAIPISNAAQGSFHQADWLSLGTSIFMALLGYFAKDKNVTGVS